MEIDYSLYLVTDRDVIGGKNLKMAVEQAILGGVTFVQVREKEISTREFYYIAREIKSVTDYYRIPLVINDRIDIALAVAADGVHLGQKDMDIQIARQILGQDKIIGISTESLEEAKEAEMQGADYIGIGTVFYTGTKKDINPPIGLKGLSEISSCIEIPKVAIGGINGENIGDIIRCGVQGAAVISAILGKENVKEATRELMELMRVSPN